MSTSWEGCWERLQLSVFAPLCRPCSPHLRLASLLANHRTFMMCPWLMWQQDEPWSLYSLLRNQVSLCLGTVLAPLSIVYISSSRKNWRPGVGRRSLGVSILLTGHLLPLKYMSFLHSFRISECLFVLKSRTDGQTWNSCIPSVFLSARLSWRAGQMDTRGILAFLLYFWVPVCPEEQDRWTHVKRKQAWSSSSWSLQTGGGRYETLTPDKWEHTVLSPKRGPGLGVHGGWPRAMWGQRRLDVLSRAMFG